MASIEEVRAGIAAANERATQSIASLQQAENEANEALTQLNTSFEGSGQSDTSEATGNLTQAVNKIEEARQLISAGMSSAEDVANRL